MKNVTKEYENDQGDYRDYYIFDFRWMGRYFELWCTEHPVNNFDKDPSKCHLFSTGKVCITAGKEPRTFEEAEAVCYYFMAGYSEYCRTGVFPDEGAMIDVPD